LTSTFIELTRYAAFFRIDFHDVYCTTSVRFWVCVVFPDVAVTVSV